MLNITRDLELVFEIGTLRFVARSWRQFGGLNFANVAEHTLRVAWLAMILAKYEGADWGRCLKMAIVHDLEETRTGDTHYLSAAYTSTNPEHAVDHTLADTSLGAELGALWREYHQCETLEAKVVKDADGLDCDMELREQGDTARSLCRALSETRRTVQERFYTSTAKQMQTLILEADPHAWHARARNRFASGD